MPQDVELLTMQRRKSRPSVVVEHFVDVDEDETGANVVRGSSFGPSKLQTIVEINDFANIDNS